jgi:hypothetical protein
MNGETALPAAVAAFAMTLEFDFQAWSELAVSDPAAFETARRGALEATIATCDQQEALWRLVWRLDGARLRAKTPLQACLVLNEMMWASFEEMRTALACFVDPPPASTPTSSPHPHLRLVSTP